MSENQKLSPAKFGLLGFQHMFAMFGATVLVPALTGLSVSATLLFAGLGTLLFHLITKGKVPAFLGSSFAFLGGYFAVAGMEQFADGAMNWIPYAGVGVAVAGLIYCVVSALFKVWGPERVMRFFPPIVTGPIIICIGMILANSAINNCAANWWIAILAVGIVIAATQNDVNMEWAKKIAESGVKYYIEVANMPTTNDALEFLKEQKHMIVAPSKAVNAGGVAVSALEMSQNSERLVWSAEEVDARLKTIMKSIHDVSAECAERYGLGYDLVAGANIAGFQKVADAMMAQGVF